MKNGKPTFGSRPFVINNQNKRNLQFTANLETLRIDKIRSTCSDEKFGVRKFGQSGTFFGRAFFHNPYTGSIVYWPLGVYTACNFTNFI